MPQFGKYELVSELASGGMAVTWRARLTGAAGITKDVVIKQIHPHLAGDPKFVQMFINEARMVASFNHGNIAQVFDFGQEGETYYLAMELVHGQTLDAVLRRARKMGCPCLPAPVAVHLAMKVCAGLHYAHTRNKPDGRPLKLVHRDVSPDNVLISYDGEVKLVDFGIAHAENRTGKKTETGMVKGKFLYFSPEQARAEDVDHRSDVFAAGVVLYQMVCGKRPYEGELVHVLPKLLQGDFPLPSSQNRMLPRAVEAAILKAMAISRDGRFASAQEFGVALNKALFAADPSFTPDRVVKFIEWLFAEELTAEGRELTADPDFDVWLHDWLVPTTPMAPPKAPLATNQDPSETIDELGNDTEEVPGSPNERALATRSERVDSDAGFSPLTFLRNWKGMAIAVTLTLGVFGLAAFISHARVELTKAPVAAPVEVWLSSEPTGADVVFDGQAQASTTPFILKNVSTDRPHTLIIEAPGRARWLRRMTFTPGVAHKLHAVLEPAP